MNERMHGTALLLLSAAVIICATWLAGTGLRDFYDAPRNMDRVLEALEQINGLESERQALLQREAALSAELDRWTRRESEALRTAGGLEEDVARAEMLAGETALTGQGVRVTLTDATDEYIESLGAGVDPSDYIVHEQDMLRVINALWSAGAEAVAVNGHRLATGDAVRCVGPSIMVGNRRLAPPFRIEAIGDGEAMKTAMTVGGQSYIYRELTAFGIGVQIDAVDRLVLHGTGGG